MNGSDKHIERVDYPSVDRPKKLVALLALALLTAWPIAHHILVERYELSPWKFFGWSMYTKRDAMVRITVINTPKTLSAGEQSHLQEALGRFVYFKKVLGKLQSPEAAAAKAFRSLGELERFGFEYEVLQLRTDTDRWQSRRFRVQCARQRSPHCLESELP